METPQKMAVSIGEGNIKFKCGLFFPELRAYFK